MICISKGIEENLMLVRQHRHLRMAEAQKTALSLKGSEDNRRTKGRHRNLRLPGGSKVMAANWKTWGDRKLLASTLNLGCPVARRPAR